MTLTSGGNVFNGWNKAATNAPAGGQKANAANMPNTKRGKKATDKEREREKIYMPFIRHEQEKLKDLNYKYKIEYVNQASR